jgi:CBS domain containing-hemolysin-like protein
MTPAYWLQIGIAVVLMILAGLIAAAEAALSSFSKARADRLVEQGRPGAKRVRKIVADPPRYLNTALFVRSMIEISAIILVANVIFSLIPKTWQAGAVTAGIMIIVSYIAWPSACRPGRLRCRRTDRGNYHRPRAISAAADHDR